MRHTLIATIFALFCADVSAQEFDRFFTDETLRVDFIFGGDSEQTGVFVDGMTATKGWYGRRGNLSQLPLLGNGQLFVADAVTGDTIYANSFTTLYLEWLAVPESRLMGRAYEHPMLMPMPRSAADISLQLIDSHHSVIARRKFRLDPADILIRRPDSSAAQHHYIGTERDPRKAIDIAILPEGYTEGELELFHKDAARAVEAILAHAPYNELADRFNFVVVDAPSRDSGETLPRKGLWRRTACGSNFDTFYTERYNTTARLRQVHTLLENIPYEHILILTNSDIYGGGGFYNDYCIASAHAPWTLEVIVHEFGHSFGGLGDEYSTSNDADNYYPSDVEPWEQNITTQKDFASKWQDMMGVDGVGLYEGAGYQEKGVFRPVENCRMRVNNVKDFCPVCQRAIKRLINFYTE